MRKNSPSLKELQAEFETALATSKVKTPLPNPALEVGPQFGFGPDLGSKSPLQPFGSLGVTIPTGKRLKRQDELNRAYADLAQREVHIRSRELYLQLRKQYSQFVLARSRHAAQKEIAASADRSASLTKKLVEAGQATALDVGLLELDQARVQTDVINAEQQIADIEGDLSELIGVHAEHFEKIHASSLPELPSSLPTLKELQTLLVANHPTLSRLRARYEVSERELHLEVAKQYPDFHFGPSFGRDVGENKNVLGLTLGIDLPIFDRNQQAIATSKKRRDEIHLKYETAANRALAVLDKTWRNYQLSTQKLILIQSVLLPKSKQNVALARKTLEAGGIDSLRFLETERGQRTLLVEALETELAVRFSWVELEQSSGTPLLLFPSEQTETTPILQETAPLPLEKETSK
jgi:outer membrane protein TolC